MKNGGYLSDMGKATSATPLDVLELLACVELLDILVVPLRLVRVRSSWGASLAWNTEDTTLPVWLCQLRTA